MQGGENFDRLQIEKRFYFVSRRPPIGQDEKFGTLYILMGCRSTSKYNKFTNFKGLNKCICFSNIESLKQTEYPLRSRVSELQTRENPGSINLAKEIRGGNGIILEKKWETGSSSFIPYWFFLVSPSSPLETGISIGTMDAWHPLRLTNDGSLSCGAALHWLLLRHCISWILWPILASGWCWRVIMYCNLYGLIVCDNNVAIAPRKQSKKSTLRGRRQAG